MHWRQTVRILTLLLIAGLVAVIVTIHDKDAVALTVVTFILLLFLPSKRAWLGLIALTVLFADVAFFTGGAAFSNIRSHERLAAVAPPAAFAALSGLGALTALIALVRYRVKDKSARGPLRLSALAVIVFAVAMVANLAVGTAGTKPHTGDLRLRAKNTAFSTKHLTSKTDNVAVFVTNGDFFWHTFTIDKLHVDLRIPEGGHRRITFTAKPGRYTFHCRVPGHTQAGMKGTLVVR